MDGIFCGPHRPSMPRVPCLSPLPARLSVPINRNPVSWSSSSDGILESHARGGSGRVLRGGCYSAALHRASVRQWMGENVMRGGDIHVSSVPVPRVFEDLGKASWSSVENEKCASTLP